MACGETHKEVLIEDNKGKLRNSDLKKDCSILSKDDKEEMKKVSNDKVENIQNKDDKNLLEEDYVSLWQRTNHGSIDLDEKFTSMTGSYSEILEDNQETYPEGENALIDDNYLNRMQRLYTSLEESRIDCNSKTCQGARPKILKGEAAPSSRCPWPRDSPEENVCELIRDFSEKNIVSRKDNICSINSISSAPLMSKTLIYPALPPIDPTVMSDLEEKARDIATSLDTLIENLTGTLHSISALSVECVETYRDAVCKTCDAVDSNIKSMYQLMAKCEELSKSMKSIYKLHDEIKEIRRLLDLFEGAVFSSSGGGGGGGGT